MPVMTVPEAANPHGNDKAADVGASACAFLAPSNSYD
jgi:hypothetical protein